VSAKEIYILNKYFEVFVSYFMEDHFFRPEHEGPAKEFWLRVVESLKPTATSMKPDLENKPEFPRTLEFINVENDENKTAKHNFINKEIKRDNIASTYGMNLHRETLIGT